MADTVDPVCYIPQIIMFCCGAIFLGLFLRLLFLEYAENNGWATTPRMVWFCTLCSCSFVFLLLQLDPYTALGIFTIGWQNFLAWFQTSLLISSVCAGLYLFLLILYSRHHMPMPAILTRVYVLVNVSATIFVFLTSMVGAITDNLFWFSVTGWVIVTQELVIFFGQTVSLTKVDQALAEQETNGFDYTSQRRKILVLRLATAILFLAAVVSQLTGFYSPLRLKWGVPVPPFDTRTFRFELVAGDFLSVVTMGVLYYVVKRPSNNASTTQDSKSSQKQKTTKLDASTVSKLTVEVN